MKFLTKRKVLFFTYLLLVGLELSTRFLWKLCLLLSLALEPFLCSTARVFFSSAAEYILSFVFKSSSALLLFLSSAVCLLEFLWLLRRKDERSLWANLFSLEEVVLLRGFWAGGEVFGDCGADGALLPGDESVSFGSTGDESALWIHNFITSVIKIFYKNLRIKQKVIYFK